MGCWQDFLAIFYKLYRNNIVLSSISIILSTYYIIFSKKLNCIQVGPA